MRATSDRVRAMSGPRKRAAEVDVASLPPGPRWPVLVQSIGLLRFRHRFVPYLQRRYGDAFTLSILPAGRHLVVFHQPEHVKEIFAGDPEIFHAGKGNAILGPVMGEHSLLLVDSTQHRRARTLLMPAFGGRALRGYHDLVSDLAREEVERWQPGVAFSSLDRMNAVTLEVILRVVFGVTDEERLARMRPLVNRVVNVSPAVFLGFGFPLLQRVGPWRRTVGLLTELDAQIYAEIAGRREAGDLAERSDVLSRLLQVRDDEGSGLTDEELRDQLVTLLLAGHETTATALAWTLHELARDRALERRAREAAQSGDDDVLEAVLKESMRVHPVIPMVVRQLMAPTVIGGVELPRGVTVGASIILAHADERSHDDAAAFRPDRFLDGEVAPHTWIPFGGGVRRCIGAGFSLMEGVAVLREVLRAYDVWLPPGQTETPRVRNITSVPHRGAMIIVTPRVEATTQEETP